MLDNNNKVNNNGADDFGLLDADEFNALKTELQRCVTSYEALAGSSDLSQLERALANYAANGNFYTDSSAVAGVHTLDVINVNTPRARPSSYFDGFSAVFVPANSSASSATVNIASLGTKDIKLSDGSDVGGLIQAGQPVKIVYSLSNDYFELFRELTKELEANLKSKNINVLDNADFSLFLLGTSFNVSANSVTTTADRWKIFAPNGDIFVDRVDSSYFTTYANEINYGLRLRPQVGSSTAPNYQRIEAQNSYGLVGKKLAFQIIINSNENIDVDFELYTPTLVDDWASINIEQIITLPIQNGEQKLKIIFDALPATAKNGLSITVRPKNYTDGFLDIKIANPQIEEGELHTSFQKVKPEFNIAACQRHRQIVSSITRFDVALGAPAVDYGTTSQLQTTLRSAPLISILSEINVNCLPINTTAMADLKSLFVQWGWTNQAASARSKTFSILLESEL